MALTDGKFIKANGAAAGGEQDTASSAYGDAEIATLTSAVALNTAKTGITSDQTTKLAGIETGATADQTGAEIKAAYEAEANTNAFTDAEKTKLAGIATAATANATDSELRDRTTHTGTQAASTISDFATAVAATASVTANSAKVTNATHTGDVTGATALTIANDAVSNAKLANMAASTIKGRVTGSTGDPEDLTATQVRSLINVEDGATADQSAAEIATAYHTQVSQVSGGEITAGTETAMRRYAPADIKAFVDAHAGGGGDLSETDIDTLAELNAILTDATLIDTSDSRLSDSRAPTAHASDHTDGTDDIQSATNAQKGLATGAHITAIEAATSHAASTSNPHSVTATQVGLGNVDNTSNATERAATATLTNKTLTSPVINTGVSGTAILDEDNMASNSATQLATQQSIKAYVDRATDYYILAASDETTALTTGTAKVSFAMPYAGTLLAVAATVSTAPTGSTIIVDLNEAGTSVLSTKLTIDASETTSATAATAAVISDSALASGAVITIDIDQVGSTIAGAGLKVYLTIQRT